MIGLSLLPKKDRKYFLGLSDVSYHSESSDFCSPLIKLPITVPDAQMSIEDILSFTQEKLEDFFLNGVGYAYREDKIIIMVPVYPKSKYNNMINISAAFRQLLFS